MKECTLCKVSKPNDEFRLFTRKGKQFLHSWCAICEREYNKQRKKPGAWKKWYDALPEDKKIEQRQKQTNRDKERKYGLTSAQLHDMLDAQYGACAACMTPITLDVAADVTWSKKASVDHDHSCCPGDKTCGKCIRGLLCGHCNRILGLIGDKITTLKALAQYLQEYSK